MIKNTLLIKKVVGEMGGVIEKIIPERNCFYISLGGEKIFVSGKFKISTSNFINGEFAKFKDLTYFMLKKEGISTPKTVCFYRKTLSKDSVDEKLSTLNYPIVVKDSNGTYSRGVFVNIRTPEEAKQIILENINKFPQIIAQEMVFGKEFRVLILKDRSIGVLEMIPPRIFGDGESTIDDLISKKQESLPCKTSRDSALDTILQEQGFTLSSIPAKGLSVFIKKNSCLLEGGETMDASEEINSEIVSLCAKAASLTRNYLVGIDIICEDITRSPNGQNLYILEINDKPDLYMHYEPTHGKARNVIRDILEFAVDLRKRALV